MIILSENAAVWSWKFHGIEKNCCPFSCPSIQPIWWGRLQVDESNSSSEVPICKTWQNVEGKAVSVICSNQTSLTWFQIGSSIKTTYTDNVYSSTGSNLITQRTTYQPISFFFTGALAIWPTGVLCRGAGDIWERTTGLSSLSVLSSLYSRSTQMKMGSTPVLNPSFKFWVFI